MIIIGQVCVIVICWNNFLARNNEHIKLYLHSVKSNAIKIRSIIIMSIKKKLVITVYTFTQLEIRNNLKYIIVTIHTVLNNHDVGTCVYTNEVGKFNIA